MRGTCKNTYKFSLSPGQILTNVLLLTKSFGETADKELSKQSGINIY